MCVCVYARGVFVCMCVCTRYPCTGVWRHPCTFVKKPHCDRIFWPGAKGYTELTTIAEIHSSCIQKRYMSAMYVGMYVKAKTCACAIMRRRCVSGSPVRSRPLRLGFALFAPGRCVLGLPLRSRLSPWNCVVVCVMNSPSGSWLLRLGLAHSLLAVPTSV